MVDKPDWGQILVALAEIEFVITDGAVPGRQVVFCRSGKWLLPRRYLLHRLLGRMGPSVANGTDQIPSLPRLGRLKILWKLLAAKRYRASSNLAGVRFSTNVRAFYPNDLNLTVHLLVTSCFPDLGSSAGRLRNELNRGTKITSSNVIRDGSVGPFRYRCEEMIRGRRFDARDWPQLTGRHFDDITQAYLRLDVVWRSAGDSYDVKNIMDIVPQMSRRLGLECPDEIAVLLKHLEGKAAQVPCVAGHGDLCVSNLLVDDTERIFIVDWEHEGHIGPVADEWSKLVSQHPPLAKRVLTLLDHFCETTDCLPSAYQLALALLKRLVSLNKILDSKPRRYQQTVQDIEAIFDLVALLARHAGNHPTTQEESVIDAASFPIK